MTAKILSLALKLNIGISRSEKQNTWTMTHVTKFGIGEEVFTGDAKSFFDFLKTRNEICSPAN